MRRHPPRKFLHALCQRSWGDFLLKLVQHIFSLSAWQWLFSGNWRDSALNLVWLSPWFDSKWVALHYPEAKSHPKGPAGFYLDRGTDGSVQPGPDFEGDEYLALHVDLVQAGINPVVNYEGVEQFNGGAVSFLDLEPRFPEGTREFHRSFPTRAPSRRRTAILASFSSDGRIRKRTMFLLRGLAEVVDNIVLVASAPLFPEEAERLNGLVSDVFCEFHGEYDFGSYKRGWRIADERGLLSRETADELILCNDSCYGPVYPLEEAFETMRPRPCDFWGMTINAEGGAEHVQSFFLVFRRPVLDDSVLEEFLSEVHLLTGRGSVIVHYETRLTGFLHERGFSYDSVVPRSICEEFDADFPNPMLRPLTLMRRWRMPLVKVKAFEGENREDPYTTLEYLQSANPELGGLVVIRERVGGESARKHKAARRLRENLPETYPGKVAAIREKASRGEPVRCVFFVSSPELFPARPLFDALSSGTAGPFCPVACIVPDRRAGNPDDAMDTCASAMAADLSGDRILRPRPNPDGVWPDMLADADVAVYPPNHFSFPFPYRPHWAVGRSFLPVLAAPADNGRSSPQWNADIHFWAELPPDGGVSEAKPAGPLTCLTAESPCDPKDFAHSPSDDNRT